MPRFVVGRTEQHVVYLVPPCHAVYCHALSRRQFTPVHLQIYSLRTHPAIPKIKTAEDDARAKKKAVDEETKEKKEAIGRLEVEAEAALPAPPRRPLPRHKRKHAHHRPVLARSPTNPPLGTCN